MMALLGGGVLLTINDHNISAVDETLNPNPASASATFRVRNDGVFESQTTQGGVVTFEPEWLTGGIPGNYAVRFTVTSGALSSGSSGVWTNCGPATLAWNVNVSRGTPGTNNASCTGTLEFRDATTLVVLDSAVVTLSAQATVDF